jgi:hypothetical protein
MAKLPGALELGPTPSADAARPVATYDVSGVRAPAQAFAQGGEALGKGVAKLGEGLPTTSSTRTAGTMPRRIRVSDAEGRSRRRDASARSELRARRQRQEPAHRYNDRRDQGARRRGRDHPLRADARSLPDRHSRRRSSRAWSRRRSTRAQGEQRQRRLRVAAGRRAHRSRDRGADDATRAQLIDSHNQLVDGLVAKGAITPLQGVEMKRTWAHQYATADLLHRADTDPEGVINELRLKPGTPEAITARIMRNRRHGAQPDLDRGRSRRLHRRDLAQHHQARSARISPQGRSDADILALRADKSSAREMTEANRGENESYLRKQGRRRDAGRAVPRALPRARRRRRGAQGGSEQAGRRRARRRGRREERRKAMIEANPSILGGKLAGSVAQWADGKMGGAAPGGGSIYDILRPDARAGAVGSDGRRCTPAHVDDLTAFKARFQDTTTEAMNTGAVEKPMTRDGVRHGARRRHRPKAHKQYQAQLQLGARHHRVASLDPEEQQKLARKLHAETGEGYAEQSKRQDGAR